MRHPNKTDGKTKLETIIDRQNKFGRSCELNYRTVEEEEEEEEEDAAKSR